MTVDEAVLDAAGQDTVHAYDTTTGRVDTLRFDDVPSTGITAIRTLGGERLLAQQNWIFGWKPPQ